VRLDRIKAGKLRRGLPVESFRKKASPSHEKYPPDGQGIANRDGVWSIKPSGLSRQERRRLRAVAHQMRTRGEVPGQQMTQAHSSAARLLSMLIRNKPRINSGCRIHAKNENRNKSFGTSFVPAIVPKRLPGIGAGGSAFAEADAASSSVRVGRRF